PRPGWHRNPRTRPARAARRSRGPRPAAGCGPHAPAGHRAYDRTCRAATSVPACPTPPTTAAGPSCAGSDPTGDAAPRSPPRAAGSPQPDADSPPPPTEAAAAAPQWTEFRTCKNYVRTGNYSDVSTPTLVREPE